MRKAVGILLLATLALPVGELTAQTAAANCREPGLAKTARYRTLPGVAANANSLDVYSASGACNAPVVLWVHGGGYHTGDKRGAAAKKAALFNRKGWLFASINYRLSEAGDPSSADFPDHYDDVSSAIAWVKANIGRYGGNPARVALLGHSAGADIVSNVANNPTYLKQHGLKLSTLACVGPLDTEGFDKVHATETAAAKLAWRDALGNNPKYRTATSATYLVKAGIGIPRTIGVYRGTAGRQKIEKAYISKLKAAGVRTTLIDARSLTHAQVSTEIGAPGDTVMTPPLVSFLTSCFGG